MQESQRSLASKTKEWEEKEAVLGHNQRGNVARPREQLAMPTAWELAEGADGAEGKRARSADMYIVSFIIKLHVCFIQMARVCWARQPHCSRRDCGPCGGRFNGATTPYTP